MSNYQRLKYAFFLLSISLNLLADIPGYIGRQSFRLTDDRELSHLLQSVDNAKVDFTRLDSSRNDMRSQIDRLVAELSKLRSEMDELNNQLVQDKLALKELEAKLVELQKNPEVNKTEIDITNASIERFNTLIKNKSTTLGQLKMQSAPLSVKLDQLNNDFKVLDIKTNEAQVRLFKLREEKDRYEKYLISEILKINREGSTRGTDDGRVDGNRLAYDLGFRHGENDGLNDGNTDGTSRGKERDYQRGASQGDRDGSAKARIDGERDGIRIGTIDGNISAATKNGNRDGKNRAEKSDATILGTKEGAIAGVKRAKEEGKRDGDILGEKIRIKSIRECNYKRWICWKF
jgi:peptidoglycan hydrolase CwlO-like protein